MKEEISEEERHIHEMLAYLREQYEKQSKPYIERLMEIRSVRDKNSIYISVDRARELGLI
jgi:hypothetical protein